MSNPTPAERMRGAILAADNTVCLAGVHYISYQRAVLVPLPEPTTLESAREAFIVAALAAYDEHDFDYADLGEAICTAVESFCESVFGHEPNSVTEAIRALTPRSPDA